MNIIWLICLHCICVMCVKSNKRRFTQTERIARIRKLSTMKCLNNNCFWSWQSYTTYTTPLMNSNRFLKWHKSSKQFMSKFRFCSCCLLRSNQNAWYKLSQILYAKRLVSIISTSLMLLLLWCSPAKCGLSCLLHPQRGWVLVFLLFTSHFLFLSRLTAWNPEFHDLQDLQQTLLNKVK